MAHFKKIGLIARQQQPDIQATALAVINYLESRHCDVLIEDETLALLSLPKHSHVFHKNDLAQHCCDLLLVVGGDGSLLNAARLAVEHNIPIVGVNRGRLGFLTDIRPYEFETKLDEILNGQYYEEQRLVLTVEMALNDTVLGRDIAINEVVIMPGHVARLIEFSIHIDQHFVCSQRADGLIIATPTGSTAYALSGGGPIVHPNLAAFTLVPMFSHTLTARPIVIGSDSVIKIKISETTQSAPRLSCDGQARVIVPIHAQITIVKKQKMLHLIHPVDYNYFETLRTKLHWSAHVVP